MDNYQNDELMHYGVPGMRWGKRKAPGYRPTSALEVARSTPKTNSYARMQAEKAKFKKSKKSYNESFNKAYKFQNRHPVTSAYGKKNKEKSKSQWEDAYDKAGKLQSAKKEYKSAKNQYKQDLKKNRETVNKNSSMGNKLLYNQATRDKAAKYMTKNNMSMSEAKKKAQGEAWRNAAIATGAAGAYVAGKAIRKKIRR